MTPKPLSELTLTELHKQKSTSKSTLITLGIVAGILLLYNLYLAIFKTPNFALTTILITLIPIGVPIFSALNKINEELKNRQ